MLNFTCLYQCHEYTFAFVAYLNDSFSLDAASENEVELTHVRNCCDGPMPNLKVKIKDLVDIVQITVQAF